MTGNNTERDAAGGCRISAVIVSLNEGPHLRDTVENFRATLPADSEVIVVDDGSEDGSADSLPSGGDVRLFRCDHFGVARARNYGARMARGKFLFFTDAHVAMRDGGWEPMVELLERPEVGGVAPAIGDMEFPDNVGYAIQFRGPDLIMQWLDRKSDGPYPAPLIPWCCGGMRRDVFEASGGFDANMIRWGMVDNEMSVRLWLQGYELWLAPQVLVAHLFKEKFPFTMQSDWFLHNTLRLAFLHFDSRRIASVVAEMAGHPDFPAALARVVTGNLFERRAELNLSRVHDSHWLFEKFPVDW
jgi:GT2 family glycosyltransferase